MMARRQGRRDTGAPAKANAKRQRKDRHRGQQRVGEHTERRRLERHPQAGRRAGGGAGGDGGGRGVSCGGAGRDSGAPGAAEGAGRAALLVDPERGGRDADARPDPAVRQRDAPGADRGRAGRAGVHPEVRRRVRGREPAGRGLDPADLPPRVRGEEHAPGPAAPGAAAGGPAGGGLRLHGVAGQRVQGQALHRPHRHPRLPPDLERGPGAGERGRPLPAPHHLDGVAGVGHPPELRGSASGPP